jgi:hypothetical protein
MKAKAMKVELWDIDKVKPYERNSKKHPKEQIAKIAASIKMTGWDQPIVVDKGGVIIKGHGRRLAAIELGFKQVPVLVRDDLTPDQVKAARISDNRAALSDIDTDLLKAELAELNGMIDELKGVFDVKEIDFLNVDTDLGTMLDNSFITDIDEAVNEQEENTKAHVEGLAQRRVPLSKVFGFKDIAGEGEIVIKRFMALAEHKTGLQADAALIEMLKASL